MNTCSDIIPKFLKGPKSFLFLQEGLRSDWAHFQITDKKWGLPQAKVIIQKKSQRAYSIIQRLSEDFVKLRAQEVKRGPVASRRRQNISEDTWESPQFKSLVKLILHSIRTNLMKQSTRRLFKKKKKYYCITTSKNMQTHIKWLWQLLLWVCFLLYEPLLSITSIFFNADWVYKTVFGLYPPLLGELIILRFSTSGRTTRTSIRGDCVDDSSKNTHRF